MVKLKAIHIISVLLMLSIFVICTVLVMLANYSFFAAALFSFFNIIGATFPPNAQLVDARSPLILASVALGTLGSIAFTITFTTIFYQVLSNIDIRYILAKQKIRRVSNHVIIAPINGMGLELAKKMRENKIATLFIDENRSYVRKALRDGFLALLGDPADPNILDEAHVDEALALYVLYDDDIKNTFVTIEARRSTKKIRIISKIKRFEDIPKAERAGARRTVLPEAAVGIEMGDFLVANS